MALPHDDAPERPALGAERVALMSGIGLAACCWLVLFVLSLPRFHVIPNVGPVIDWRPGLAALVAALTSFVLALRLVRLDHRAGRETMWWIDVSWYSITVALFTAAPWMITGGAWLLYSAFHYWPVTIPVITVLGLAIGVRLLIHGVPAWLREAPADANRRSAADDHHPVARGPGHLRRTEKQ